MIEQGLTYIIISLSGISLISSLIFIIIFFSTKNYASKFLLKLILYIQLSDAILAVGIILLVAPVKENFPVCIIQAFLIQFGALNSTLTRLIVNIIVYLALKKDGLSFKTFENYAFFIGFVISLILSAIPFFTDDYGFTGIWCWISFTEPEIMNVKSSLVAFVTFYFELWVSVIMIIILNIKISNHLKKLICKSSVRKMRRKLKYYPLVIIVCWLFPFIDRITRHFYGEIRVLAVMDLVTISLQGFLNFLVYSYRYVRKSMKNKEKARRSLIPR